MAKSFVFSLIGKTVILHGTLGKFIDEVKWAHEIPDAFDDIYRPLKITLFLSELGIPEGESRIDVFFGVKQQTQIESLFGQEVLLKCKVVGASGRGFGTDEYAPPIVHRAEAILIGIKSI